MPISMPGDPPPKPSHRWVLPIVLALFFAGIAVPFLVVRHHTSVVENNQNQAIDALRNFARLQDSYFAVNKRFAISFEELGGPWIEIKDMRAQKSTDYHGYRFRFFASSVQSAGRQHSRPRRQLRIDRGPNGVRQHGAVHLLHFESRRKTVLRRPRREDRRDDANHELLRCPRQGWRNEREITQAIVLNFR